jgi:hypothetical protein
MLQVLAAPTVSIRSTMAIMIANHEFKVATNKAQIPFSTYALKEINKVWLHLQLWISNQAVIISCLRTKTGELQ